MANKNKNKKGGSETVVPVKPAGETPATSTTTPAGTTNAPAPITTQPASTPVLNMNANLTNVTKVEESKKDEANKEEAKTTTPVANSSSPVKTDSKASLNTSPLKAPTDLKTQTQVA